MPQENFQEMQNEKVEKFMLLIYFVYSVVIVVIGLLMEWKTWVVLFTVACWLFGAVCHWTGSRTYVFRAYTMAILMQMSIVVTSVAIQSLSMTVPLFLVNAVILIFYGLPEISYIPVISFLFLCIYHLLIARTIDFSSKNVVLESVLEISCVLLLEYMVYFLNKARRVGMDQQMQIIESLKEAEQSKDDFMANVSHEIRTPINTICGMSEIVLREDLEDSVRANVFNIQTAGRNLQSIVSDVLDFTEMQSGKMTLVEEVYNITSTINDVINMSMARKNEKDIDLIVDCEADIPSGLIGDEQKIRRVIMNLFNNAIKFTEEGCVSIILQARKTDYGINLIVRIKDTGIGMKKESMEKLFRNFNQADTRRNRQKEGVGLGIAISQILVDMMGGFITVSSEYGKGSEVQFVIPQKVSDATPIALVKDRERINVAIYVDMERYDRPEVREAYSQVILHMIAQLKVKCHVCQNLPELKRRAQRENFTHVFISIEEYEEDIPFFNQLAETTKLIAIIERYNEARLLNPKIMRMYKPFFILPIVMALNEKQLLTGSDVNSYFREKFIAPDTNVLIVDDNLMNIRVLEGLLQPYQIKAAIATSGAEALEKIENMSYDVVFMDHMMPEMDGIETLQRIRQKQGNYFKKLPVVAVTANAVGGMREVFLNEGFQDFIAKPIEVSVLERVLKRILPQEKLKVVPEEAWENKPKQQAETESRQEENETNTGLDLPPQDFNEHIGLKYCGSEEGYLEVLRLVYDSGAEEQDKLEQAFRKKEWKNYTTFVHGLKSTMQSIGVKNLSDMARELELAGKQGEEAYILKHHYAMMTEYDRILKQLERSRAVCPQEPEEDSGGRESLEEEQLDRIALEFEDAAFAFDTDQMLAIADRLAQCTYNGHSLSGLAETAKHKIQMSDYLSAAETVSRYREFNRSHGRRRG